MSRKGNDLVRSYLWNAARSAIRHNPAVRALYRRLRAKGKRGDVAMGHCMRKLLHLVYAVWKTNRPFDKDHYPWEGAGESQSSPPAPPAGDGTPSADERAVGHKRDLPAEGVVTTADSTVDPGPAGVKPTPRPTTTRRPQVDYEYLRSQVTMRQVLEHLGRFAGLRGGGQQRRGPCPVHSQGATAERSFSVHLGKNIFQCFHAGCGLKGNVLDLWAAVRRLPLYEAALDLAGTFHLALNRVSTAWAVLPTNRPMSGSELTDHSSDSESRTRLLILVGERANDDFQIDLLAQREVGPTGRGEILHQVRTILGRHVVRHKLQVLLQRPLRPPGHAPPEPQPSAARRVPRRLCTLGLPGSVLGAVSCDC